MGVTNHLLTGMILQVVHVSEFGDVEDVGIVNDDISGTRSPVPASSCILNKPISSPTTFRCMSSINVSM